MPLVQLEDAVLRGDLVQVRTLLDGDRRLKAEATGQLIVRALEANRHAVALFLAGALRPSVFELAALGMQGPLHAMVRQSHGQLTARDAHGRTALHLAAAFERDAVVKLLLELGAAANATDHRGRTPLHHAAMRGSIRSVIALQRVSNLSHEDDAGQTALAIAIEHDHVEVTKFLADWIEF